MATAARGRTNIPKPSSIGKASKPTGVSARGKANRGVKSGAGPHRGDRRDTHPSFSTGKAGRGSTAGHARDGGRSGPLGASGRKSGPKSG